MKATMLLADFAQVLEGKLYIMGGGWSVTGPQPVPSAIAVKIEVPWNATNQKHSLKLELLDSDYRPVSLPSDTGNRPVVVSSDFEVGRPVGLPPGVPIDLPFAVNLGPLPLPPGGRFVWRLTIDGKSEDDWQAAFSTRAAAAR
ncbi:MAG TPA: hypothetical protein VNI01_02595 [Elusimicrobiota bacterium]|nr:hypothetical protein [Elusimicrobiota bacterium]